MRVTMLLHITGYRDGEPWPHAGGVIDLPEREARELIAQNYATEAPPVHRTTSPDRSTATRTPPRTPPPTRPTPTTTRPTPATNTSRPARRRRKT